MLACSIVLWGGRNTANKYHWRVWGVLAVFQPHRVCPTHGVCSFPVYTVQAPGCSAGELSEAGPGLCALPRSKALRFRFSGTPQRRRFGWACVLCPSQVRAAQVTRCLASTVTPSWGVHLIASPVPAAQFSQGTMGLTSQVCHVSLLGSWSLAATLPADVNHPKSQEVLVSNEACLQFGRGCLSVALIGPFQLWLYPPACLWWGMGQSTAG